MFSKKRGIFRDGKVMVLAYDQGFEHGPRDFNLENINPDKIFDIALKGNFTAIAVQAGIAQKHYHGKYRKVPLIVKLNAKDRFDNHDPLSLAHTSVEYAKKLGASGVGYTLYLGSTHEQEMFKEFGRICEKAKELGLITMCWMYPRGPKIKNELDTETISYGARIAMELGADIVKVKFNGDVEGLKWIKECAGKTKVVIAGGKKLDEYEFLEGIEKAMTAEIAGLAIGRNVWQDKNPLDVARGLNQLVFHGKTAKHVVEKPAVEEKPAPKLKISLKHKKKQEVAKK